MTEAPRVLNRKRTGGTAMEHAAIAKGRPYIPPVVLDGELRGLPYYSMRLPWDKDQNARTS